MIALTAVLHRVSLAAVALTPSPDPPPPSPLPGLPRLYLPTSSLGACVS